MTEEQYVSGWAKAKERTSSGTSGLHFGHFKANSTMKETLDIDLKLLQMTIILGYSLVRWRSAVDVMIPKKANSKRAEQLRVICLMEPDFNFMNKWMGKITMTNAEEAKSIAPEQFGSRKNKSAIQHALNKALCFDTIRNMKDDAALTVLDAKSCYDRIPPPLACLCLRRQGLPQNIIDASFNSIKDMTHHICTAYGISQVSYERNDDSYMHGILQGNGAGPCIWVMLSSPILDMLADQGNGASLHLPDGQVIKVVAFAFVDDIDLIQKLPKSNPLAALQHDFDIWENGLKTISGALVWEKCDVYILQNIWDDRLHNWKLADKTYCPGSIKVRNEDQVREITRKEPDEATLSLGVMFAPSGDMKDQVQHLRKKAETWADLLRTKKISPEAVWYSLTASIMKSIEYPLLATTMSQKDVTYIMAPILLSALPRAKICRYFNRDVLYSLPMHQGLGLQNPYYTQGLRKLMEVLHEDCLANPTSKFIQAANLAMELFTGLGPNYLSVTMNKLILKTVPNSIMRSLWEFLSEYKIQLSCLTNDRKQFPFDNFIMLRIFLSKLKPKEVATFNFCRIYLQIESISEFITTDGKQIQQHVWHGMLLHHRLDTRKWATQPKPTGTAWTTFRKILQHIFNTNDAGVLTVPIPIDGWVRRQWKWFYCPDTARLFEATCHNIGKVRGAANSGSKRSRRHNNMFWKSSTFSLPIPANAIPVTVYDNHGFLNLDNLTPLPSMCSQLVTVRWSDFLRVQRNRDMTSMDQAFLKGHLVLVSDGSYKDSVGSAAWILASLDTHETFVTGQCPTTGPPHAQDSHRSELFGILGGLLFLKSYLSKFQFRHQHSLVVGLDNTSAMNYVFDNKRYPIVKSYFPDFDVIAAARSLLSAHITYNTIHIAGHQDDDFIGPLDFLPTLNVRMDAACKAFRGKTTSDLSNAILPNQRYRLSDQNHMICKKVEKTISEGISAKTMAKYWEKHNELSTVHFPLVSWHAIGLAMKRESPFRQHWLVKHATGICGVNEKLVEWKEKDSELCVRCKMIENAAHVWSCRHPSSRSVWDQALVDLKEWLIHNSTAPEITQALIQGLSNWYNKEPVTQGCMLTTAQMTIGWQYVITGRLHIDWIIVQQHHFIKIGRGKKSSLRWLSKLISRIWKIAWDLWDKRNEFEHADDQVNRNREYTGIIEQEWAYGYADLHESCYYFFSEREISHLRTNATVEYKRNWIALVTAARFVVTSASLPLPIIPIAPLPV